MALPDGATPHRLQTARCDDKTGVVDRAWQDGESPPRTPPLEPACGNGLPPVSTGDGDGRLGARVGVREDDAQRDAAARGGEGLPDGTSRPDWSRPEMAAEVRARRRGLDELQAQVRHVAD